MSKLDNIYEPAEDSSLLLKSSLEYLKKNQQENNKQLNICEVGVGSGFIISNLAKQYPNHNYFGTDINPDAIEITKQKFRKINIKINLKQTNLLENTKQKFNLIIFNTPYLPMERGEKYEELTLKDKAIYGGKKGYEIIEQFIYQINDKLLTNGEVIILYSSQSNHRRITEILDMNFFQYEIIEKKRVFFEDLYSLKITRTQILEQLSELQVTQIKYLARGKHSKILTGIYKNKNVIIKIGQHKDLQIEEIFLTKFEKYNFSPKLYLAKQDFVIMEKLEGINIGEFITTKQTLQNTQKVFNSILKITKQLDDFGVNKLELINPKKHIFINKNLNVKFIDFERALYSPSPKNTTQILEYIRRLAKFFIKSNIHIDENKIFKISKKYKEKPFDIKFENLLK